MFLTDNAEELLETVTLHARRYQIAAQEILRRCTKFRIVREAPLYDPSLVRHVLSRPAWRELDTWFTEVL